MIVSTGHLYFALGLFKVNFTEFLRINLLYNEIFGVFLWFLCKNMHTSSMLNRLIIKDTGKLTLKMLQIGNEAGKLSPVTRLWSWKKSSISTVTSHEGDGSKSLIGFVSPNVSLKSGSKTVVWSGRKKIWKRPNLRLVMVMASVMALMTRHRVPNLLHNDNLRVLLRQISCFKGPILLESFSCLVWHSTILHSFTITKAFLSFVEPVHGSWGVDNSITAVVIR